MVCLSKGQLRVSGNEPVHKLPGRQVVLKSSSDTLLVQVLLHEVTQVLLGEWESPVRQNLYSYYDHLLLLWLEKPDGGRERSSVITTTCDDDGPSTKPGTTNPYDRTVHTHHSGHRISTNYTQPSEETDLETNQHDTHPPQTKPTDTTMDLRLPSIRCSVPGNRDPQHPLHRKAYRPTPARGARNLPPLSSLLPDPGSRCTTPRGHLYRPIGRLHYSNRSVRPSPLHIPPEPERVQQLQGPNPYNSDLQFSQDHGSG